MEDTKQFAKEIRILSLKMVHAAKASHIGGALSMADILAVLYNDILSYDNKNPYEDNRDRFLLSKGHACVSLYATLALKGFFDKDKLSTYAQDGSYFLSHISHKIPGVELSAGSLGHILSIGCGMAYAAKLKHQNWRTFCLLGDGEMDEGSVWEAILFAPQHQLDNLVLIIDYNKIQAMGNVENIIKLDSLKNKLESFGWTALDVDGHHIEQLEQTFKTLPFEKNKPTAIIAHTIKGCGVDFMENQLEWHYKSPDDKQLQNAIKQINKQ